MAKTQGERDVDEYISKQPVANRKVLNDLRRIIKSTCPEAEEKISYMVVGYMWKGRLIFFGGYDDYCSLYGVRSLFAKYKKELKGFKIKGSTLYFTPQKPLLASLVKKMVKDRMQENDDRKREQN